MEAFGSLWKRILIESIHVEHVIDMIAAWRILEVAASTQSAGSSAVAPIKSECNLNLKNKKESCFNVVSSPDSSVGIKSTIMTN